MISHYFICSLFALTGVVALLAALLNWDWFFTAKNSQFIVQNVGRKQARWFYGALGALLIGTALFFVWQTPATA